MKDSDPFKSIRLANEELRKLTAPLDALKSLKPILPVEPKSIRLLREASSRISSQNEQMLAAIRSPFLEQVYADATRYSKLIEQASSAASGFQKSIHQQSTAFRAMHNAVLGTEYQRFAESLQRTTAQFSIQSSVVDRYINAIRSTNKFAEALQSTTAYRVLDSLQDRDATFDEAFQELKATVATAVDDGQSSPISFEGWLQIILVLFFYILTSHVDEERHDDITSQLAELQTELVMKFDQLSADDLVNAKFFIATNGLNVRTEPSAKSQKFAVIYPNQKVRQVKQEGNWLYVEYFDYLEELPRTGWVYKRFLKQIETEQDD